MGVEYDARFGIGIEIDVSKIEKDIYDYLDSLFSKEMELGYIIWGDCYDNEIKAAVVIKKDNLVLDPIGGKLTLKNQIEDLIEFVRCAKIPTVGDVGLVGGLFIY